MLKYDEYFERPICNYGDICPVCNKYYHCRTIPVKFCEKEQDRQKINEICTSCKHKKENKLICTCDNSKLTGIIIQQQQQIIELTNLLLGN